MKNMPYTYSDREIQLMDELFKHLVNDSTYIQHNKSKVAKWINAKNIDEVEHLIREIAKYIERSGDPLFKVKHYNSREVLLYDVNTHRCTLFTQRGGFKVALAPPPPIVKPNTYKKHISQILIGVLLAITGALVTLYLQKLLT